MKTKIIDGEKWSLMDTMPVDQMMKEFDLPRKMVESMLHEMEYNRPDVQKIDGEFYIIDE